MEADCKIFEAVGGYNALLLPSLRCIIGFRVQNMYVMYTACVCSAILLVQPVNPKLRFMHKYGVQVKPDSPLMGGSAGMPH